MSSSEPATLTWLHISDLHLREKTSWAQDIVLSHLLEDVARRFGSRPPDLIFVTGDIAFSGNPREYEMAEEFLRALCGRLGVGLDRLFVIPGNHDIQRDSEEDAFVGARHGLRTAADVDRFLDNAGRRKTLFARQAAFRKFANRMSASGPIYTEDSYQHCRFLNVRSIRVRVMLLDSTWLSEGGEDDAAELLVGERQVFDAAKATSPDGGTLTFALLHHPFSWLRDFEQVGVENAITAAAEICLRGHVHVPDRRIAESHLGRMAIFTAGATFQTRTADNTYLVCSLDLASGRGTKTVHRYVHAEMNWQAAEPQGWSLVPSAAMPNARVAYGLVGPRCPRYGYYVACLLAGLVAEVPVSIGGRGAFVATTAEVPDVINEVGRLITHLRYHVHWRRVWQAGAWQSEFDGIVDRIVLRLGQHTELQGELDRREASCRLLFQASASEQKSMSALREEIAALLRGGDIDQARRVVDRWLATDALNIEDRRTVRREHARVLIHEGHARAALIVAEELVTEGRLPNDLALAAACAHKAGDSQRAAAFMHDAISAGVGVDEVRELALAIAGKVGDSSLVTKVRGA